MSNKFELCYEQAKKITREEYQIRPLGLIQKIECIESDMCDISSNKYLFNQFNVYYYQKDNIFNYALNNFNEFIKEENSNWGMGIKSFIKPFLDNLEKESMRIKLIPFIFDCSYDKYHEYLQIMEKYYGVIGVPYTGVKHSNFKPLNHFTNEMTKIITGKIIFFA